MNNKTLDTRIGVEDIFTSDQSPKIIFENSDIIYGGGYDEKLYVLEDIIRFSDDITYEQLVAESTKLHTYDTNTSKKLQTAIEARIKRNIKNNFYMDTLMIKSLDGDVFPRSNEYGFNKLIESVSMESATDILESVCSDNRQFITPSELFKSSQVLINAMPDQNHKTFTLHLGGKNSAPLQCEDVYGVMDIIADKICNTVKYECKDPHYKDLPILQSIEYIIDAIEQIYSDCEEILDNLESMMSRITSRIQDKCGMDIYDSLKECGNPCNVAFGIGSQFTFNPNPFNMNQIDGNKISPMITRTIQRSLIDIFNAETDEEITESLVNYGRLERMVSRIPSLTDDYRLPDGAETNSIIDHDREECDSVLIESSILIKKDIDDGDFEASKRDIKDRIENLDNEKDATIMVKDIERAISHLKEIGTKYPERYTAYKQMSSWLKSEALPKAREKQSDLVGVSKSENDMEDLKEKDRQKDKEDELKRGEKETNRDIKKINRGIKHETRKIGREAHRDITKNKIKAKASSIKDKVTPSKLKEGYDYDYYREAVLITEAGNKISKGARSVSRKIQGGTVKATHKASSTAKDVKISVKKAVDPMSNFVQDSVRKFKEADESQRRELILKGKSEATVTKIWRWVKRLLAAGAISFIPSVGPMLAGIGLITSFLTDKHFDNKVRITMLKEMEAELKIVNEKIDDSRGDENKQAKYELMRIKNQLEHDIDRIKLRLKY